MTFNYCTFDPLAEHVCRYPEGFSVTEGTTLANHIPISDPDYQEWLASHPEGAPLYNAAGQPWDKNLLPPPPTISEKLAALGIDPAELKATLEAV